MIKYYMVNTLTYIQNITTYIKICQCILAIIKKISYYVKSNYILAYINFNKQNLLEFYSKIQHFK